MDALFAADLDALTGWVEGRGDATEVWLRFERVRYGTRRVSTLTVAGAAEILAGISWVESGRAAVDRDHYAVRFAPGTPPKQRTPPTWARADFRAEEMELAAEFADQFRADAAAWEFFEKQTPKYRRTAVWWVMSGKAEETRRRRIAALIESSAKGERLAALQRQM